MNGIGAQEICVTTAQGVCDFISAMDTARVPEWNCWYHIMNCGFPLKVSGETDFPCISGSRVGQGRVYVQLGKVDKVDFAAWCEGTRQGPVVRLRRLRPRPGVHGQRQAAGRRGRSSTSRAR